MVSKANQYAKDHGKTPFCIYQGNWSVLDRSFERDIIPMARSEGLALAPWGVLGGGKIRTNAEEARRKESGEKGRTVFGDWERTPEQRKVCDVLEEIGKEVGTESITSSKWKNRTLQPPKIRVGTYRHGLNSRNRVPPPKAPLCIPHYRWPKS